jgi:7-cyano-7-deazaguanine synthase
VFVRSGSTTGSGTIESIAALAGIPVTSVIVDSVIFKGAESSQTNARVAVPKGHYEDASMRTTVVPNRNMILLSLAGAVAEGWNAQCIAYAAHAGDHAIYPDCRPEFVMHLNQALRTGTYNGVELYTPFVQLRKEEIVVRGKQLRAPFHLTYSCYEGRPRHCGACGTCTERREAFRLAGVTDPTEYES